MFYSDIRREPLRTRISNFILRFSRHYDQYANGVLIRTVDIAREVVWC